MTLEQALDRPRRGLAGIQQELGRGNGHAAGDEPTTAEEA